MDICFYIYKLCRDFRIKESTVATTRKQVNAAEDKKAPLFDVSQYETNVNDNKIISINNEINTVKIENKYFMIYEIGPKF